MPPDDNVIAGRHCIMAQITRTFAKQAHNKHAAEIPWYNKKIRQKRPAKWGRDQRFIKLYSTVPH